MTLAGLSWVTETTYLRETDDGRFRIRKRFEAVTGDWQYFAYKVGPSNREDHLGTFASCAEAEACCAFAAFPSEVRYPEQEPAR